MIFLPLLLFFLTSSVNNRNVSAILIVGFVSVSFDY